jgi:hypothetical protein
MNTIVSVTLVIAVKGFTRMEPSATDKSVQMVHRLRADINPYSCSRSSGQKRPGMLEPQGSFALG